MLPMSLLDSWFKIDLGEGAFYAVFGFLFVFLGIALLILIFTALGILMKRVNARKTERKQENRAERATEEFHLAPPPNEGGLTPEKIAVITAAIAAYYEESAEKCEFVVKRIKRL